MEFLSDCIADFYIKRRIINFEEKDIYKAGIKLILNEAFTFLIVILIAILISEVWHGIVFLTVFCITRIYSGGFHAKTTFVCRTTMLVTFISVILLLKVLLGFGLYSILCVIVISNMILLPIIPVKHPNKSLTNEQRKRNRIKGTYTICLFSSMSIILFFFNKQSSILISLSLLAVSILALIGKLINERRVKNEKVCR